MKASRAQAKTLKTLDDVKAFIVEVGERLAELVEKAEAVAAIFTVLSELDVRLNRVEMLLEALIKIHEPTSLGEVLDTYGDLNEPNDYGGEVK